MAKLTENQKDIVNRMNPTTQEVQLGTILDEAQAGQMLAYTVTKTADFTTASALFTAPFAMEIVDVIAEAHATEGSGSVKVMKDTTEICTAVVCAADGVVSHMVAGANNATRAHRILAAGDVINIQAAGGTAANIKGRVTVIGVRL
jgi:hypothetical protein